MDRSDDKIPSPVPGTSAVTPPVSESTSPSYQQRNLGAHQPHLFISSLLESVRTYEMTVEKIQDEPRIIPLVAERQKEVQEMIAKNCKEINELLSVDEQLKVDVRSLKTCRYAANTFANIISKIQNVVDDLSLKQYSDFDIWINSVDKEIEKNLSRRQEAGIAAWIDAFRGVIDHSMDSDAPAEPRHKPGGDPHIQVVVLKADITNQTMDLHPSIEEAHMQIIKHLKAWMEIVMSQRRLQSSRCQVGVDKPVTETYEDILSKLRNKSVPLERAYRVVDNTIKEIHNCVDKFMTTCQSLWDLQADNLPGKLGDDISKWMECLNDIEKAKNTFDTSDTRRVFGPFVIDFEKVQRELSLQFDSWYKETLSKFASILGNDF